LRFFKMLHSASVKLYWLPVPKFSARSDKIRGGSQADTMKTEDPLENPWTHSLKIFCSNMGIVIFDALSVIKTSARDSVFWLRTRYSQKEEGGGVPLRQSIIEIIAPCTPFFDLSIWIWPIWIFCFFCIYWT